MYKLPEKFIEKMKKQLPPSEWEAFFAVYEKEPYKAVRINPLKLTAEEFIKISPYALRKVAWAKNAYYVTEEKVGAHPYHFAGLFYSQEPSATCAVPLLGIEKGDRVLDLCAAPGGKSTQIAGELLGTGLLVSNELVFSRAQILSGNIERLGVKNAVVTSETPARLSAFFGGYFDKILVDAPCSGEGMFRKNAEEAYAEWSEENVELCVRRQAEILDEATKMLRTGGRLVYSTCTFSVEEDEEQIAAYLKNHPEMRLVKTEKLYPHRVEGEGHFAALLEKTDGGERERVKPIKAKCGGASEKLWQEFRKQTLLTDYETVYEGGGALYALPNGVFDWRGLNVLRVGVRLGEVRGGRFEPSHALAMSLKKEECTNVLALTLADGRTEKFLRGEEIEAEEVKKGWCLVCVDGYSVGWGKASGGRVKNHIPKALRKMK